jgi:hypothetical protein
VGGVGACLDLTEVWDISRQARLGGTVTKAHPKLPHRSVARIPASQTSPRAIDVSLAMSAIGLLYPQQRKSKPITEIAGTIRAFVEMFSTGTERP